MCKPCNIFNYQLTAAKDAEYIGSLPAVNAKMNSFINNNQVKGCALGIVCNNKIHYLKTYGYSRDNGTETAYQYYMPGSIGSISKTMTALAILRLYERGFLDINDPINLHLASTPVNWSGTKIIDLLAHQSGLPWDPVMNFPSKEEDLKKKFPEGGDHPGIHPRFAYYGYRKTNKTGPSGTTAYSNVGYCILGAIIDFITTDESNDFDEVERGYENFVWWNVGMKGGKISGEIMQTPCLNAYWRKSEIPNLAFDYPDNSDSFFNIKYTGWEGPPGGWTMTISDLARLMIMINTNQIITQETKDIMMSDYGPFGISSVGLGIFRPNMQSQKDEYFDQEAFFHSGRIGNYDARYTMWPSKGFGIALMFNSRTSPAAIKGLTLDIAELFIANRFTSLCSINDVVYSSSDSERINSQLYHFLKYHKQDLINIVALYQYKHGSLQNGVQEILNDLGESEKKKLLKHVMEGEFETIARMANHLFKEKIGKLESPANSLPVFDIKEARCK